MANDVLKPSIPLDTQHSGLNVIGWVFEKFGPVGVLCWLLYYLVATELPQQRGMYRDETKFLRDQQTTQHIELVKVITDNQRSIEATQRSLSENQRVIADILLEVKRIKDPKDKSGDER